MTLVKEQHEKVMVLFREFLREDIHKQHDLVSTPIAELGLDSLDYFEFITSIEEELSVSLELDALDENVKLQDILNLLN